MSTATLKKPARTKARDAAPLAAKPCAAEQCLREWVKLVRAPRDESDARSNKRHAERIACEERASQALARSDVGAAFQLLLAATAWPWRQSDSGDPTGISDDAMDSITDGTDFKRRLMISAYFHVSRNIADTDLRDAERWMTAEEVDGGGIMQWLRDSQSTLTFRDVI
jgi:hypothetical protein